MPPPFCFLGRTSFLCPMRFVPLTCVPCFPFACSLSRCTCLSYSRAFYSLSFCRTPFLRLRAFRFTCAPSLFFLRVPAVSARPPFLFFPPSISPPPFSPLPSSFRCFPSPILCSFPLLRFPFRKKFPLKSRVISSVKYMFYSIFLVCLGKFS